MAIGKPIEKKSKEDYKPSSRPAAKKAKKAINKGLAADRAAARSTGAHASGPSVKKFWKASDTDAKLGLGVRESKDSKISKRAKQSVASKQRGRKAKSQ